MDSFGGLAFPRVPSARTGIRELFSHCDLGSRESLLFQGNQGKREAFDLRDK